jgi:hypothetical protein
MRYGVIPQQKVTCENNVGALASARSPEFEKLISEKKIKKPGKKIVGFLVTNENSFPDGTSQRRLSVRE